MILYCIHCIGMKMLCCCYLHALTTIPVVYILCTNLSVRCVCSASALTAASSYASHARVTDSKDLSEKVEVKTSFIVTH